MNKVLSTVVVNHLFVYELSSKLVLIELNGNTMLHNYPYSLVG